MFILFQREIKHPGWNIYLTERYCIKLSYIDILREMLYNAKHIPFKIINKMIFLKGGWC